MCQMSGIQSAADSKHSMADAFVQVYAECIECVESLAPTKLAADSRHSIHSLRRILYFSNASNVWYKVSSGFETFDTFVYAYVECLERVECLV